MTSSRLLRVTFALLTVLLLRAASTNAAPVTYIFTGVCVPDSNPGDCGPFGLSDGDAVTGSLTLNADLLGDSAFTTFLPTDPDLDFIFHFGNVSFVKSNLDPFINIRVMLSDAAGTGIVLQNAVFACIDAYIPCAVSTKGAVLFQIGTGFGAIDRNLGDGLRNRAATLGAWTVATPVPEPSALILFGAGIAGLLQRRKRH